MTTRTKTLALYCEKRYLIPAGATLFVRVGPHDQAVTLAEKIGQRAGELSIYSELCLRDISVDNKLYPTEKCVYLLVSNEGLKAQLLPRFSTLALV